MTLIGKILSKYVGISNRMTSYYEKKYGLFCDIYFPLFGANANADGNYDKTSIFSTHQPAEYSNTPNITNIKFYIPQLLRKESMNSTESEFDSFYMEGDDDRPFIETSKSRELPIQSKVVVFIEKSTLSFTVEKKTVVQGANGVMLLRMYLDAIAEG
jgi:hypothetical protein